MKTSLPFVIKNIDYFNLLKGSIANLMGNSEIRGQYTTHVT